MTLLTGGGFVLISFTSTPMTTTAALAQEPNNAIANMTTTSENLLHEERGNTISDRVIATANDSAAIEVTYNASGIYNGTLLLEI